jgi:hypothetical protein
MKLARELTHMLPIFIRSNSNIHIHQYKQLKFLTEISAASSRFSPANQGKKMLPIDARSIAAFSMAQLTRVSILRTYLLIYVLHCVMEPALHWLLIFQVPNLMSLFRCLARTKVSVQIRDFLHEPFVTRYVFTVRSC